METIMPPNFMGGAAKIIAEIRNRTCIDDNDVTSIEKILQDALREYYEDGYEDGYEPGYEDGYEHGYDDGHAKKHY